MIGEMQAKLTEPDTFGQTPISIPEKDATQASFLLEMVLKDTHDLEKGLEESSRRRMARALQIMGEMSLANSILLT
jgi:hypothetical protein